MAAKKAKKSSKASVSIKVDNLDKICKDKAKKCVPNGCDCGGCDCSHSGIGFIINLIGLIFRKSEKNLWNNLKNQVQY